MRFIIKTKQFEARIAIYDEDIIKGCEDWGQEIVDWFKDTVRAALSQAMEDFFMGRGFQKEVSKINAAAAQAKRNLMYDGKSGPGP